jgi:hypothetical protein
MNQTKISPSLTSAPTYTIPRSSKFLSALSETLGISRVIMSERLVKDDVYTSIHIEEYESEARDTKLGPEESKLCNPFRRYFTY